MSDGKGGGGGSAIVGYRYFLGVQLNVCHGPVDNIRRIIIGERVAWEGSVGGNTTININKPELFGGDSREGGVVGDVDVAMGASDQARNSYLATHQGATCPAYRGVLSLIFKSFMWSSGNPYFKSTWVEATRILSGWSTGAAWNSANAVINTLDMNPAHIIYQCLTDTAWGMGYNVSDIGDESFTAAAATLKAENFGLSLPWDEQTDIEAFIGSILTHINGSLGVNMSTGKFELRLIRDDYVIGDLVELNESNVLEMKSFQRAALGDSINEVVVTYTDREGNEKPVAVQNLASIAAQGGVVSTTKAYPGIREHSLAARVAMRDLTTLSAPLAQATLITNRVLWDKDKGDVVSLVWPRRGINGVPFRIVEINKGNLTDSKIEVSLVEDVFGLPSSAYVATQSSQWVDSLVAPIAADAALAVEAPYWEVVKNLSLADQAQLQDQYGFGMFMACRGAVQSPLGYKLVASPDDVTYVDVGAGAFNPTGVLAAGIDHVQTTLSLSGAYDLSRVVLSADGGYAFIGNECMSVVSCNPSTGAVVVGRGILDTVPAPHASGARVFFRTAGTVYDKIERVSGETVYYKPLPTTGLGTLHPIDADAEVVVFANRASRPYPPGKFQVNNSYYPASIPGPNVTATWAHRDRVAQTVSFVDHTVANIGPEPGVSYRMRVFSGATLKRTYDIAGDVTTWTYPSNDDLADGSLLTMTLALSSVRDGVESMFAATHSFTRSVATGGVYVEGPPAKPTLVAASGSFDIGLSWTFGDARTNLEYTELRVSRSPIFSDPAELIYPAYPLQAYTVEVEEVGASRWCWARVGDTNGQLSEWSDVAFAKSGKGGVPSVSTLPAAPVNGVDVVRLASDSKLYIWTGTAWITGVAADDITGEISGVNIAAGTIAAIHIAADAVTADKIAASAVSTDKLDAGAVTANKIAASAVTADKVAASAVTADKIAASAVTADKVAANAVTADKIAAAAITAGKIAANAITASGGEIADLAVSTLKLQDDAVTVPSSVSGNTLVITSATYPIGTKLLILATCNFSYPNGSTAYLYLNVDGVTMSTRMGFNALANPAFSSGNPGVISCTHVMSAATHTITLTSSATASTPEIIAIGMKK